ISLLNHNFLVLSCVGVAVLSQERQAMCRRMASRCQSRQTRNGRSNDVSRVFNQQCRRRIRNWQDISRCELGRATCQLTWESCQTISCANVRRVLGGGGSNPSPRTTTRRTPTPRTSTRRSPRTTRRNPTPRTTRRGPTPRTTRRDPLPQTTRRSPTPRTTRRNPSPRTTRTPDPAGRRTTTTRTTTRRSPNP
ncbi:hypothetical protein KR074_012314, partial [Drosophila pseudoananassae]